MQLYLRICLKTNKKGKGQELSPMHTHTGETFVYMCVREGAKEEKKRRGRKKTTSKEAE